MDIQAGSLTHAHRVLQKAAIEARYQTALGGADGTGSVAADRLSVSSDGQERYQLRARLLEQAAALPEVREERLAQVRARMAAGFYDGEVIVATIGERMLEDGALRTPDGTGAAAADTASPSTVPDASYRTDLMNDVQNKIQSGFYSDNDVMNFVADRLLDIYQISPEEQN